MSTLLLNIYIQDEKNNFLNKFIKLSKIIQNKLIQKQNKFFRKLSQNKFFKNLKKLNNFIENILSSVFKNLRSFMKDLNKPEFLENIMLKIKQKLEQNALKILTLSVFTLYIFLVISS